MFRTHGRPDIAREDHAIDELAARVRRVRRVALWGVVTASLAAMSGVLYLAATAGTSELGLVLTGKATGALAAGALLGTLFGGHALAAQVTLHWAERAARALGRERRCDEEPLVEAARLLAGGRVARGPDGEPEASEARDSAFEAPGLSR